MAAVSPDSSPTYLNAFRYDAYGKTCGTWHASAGSLTVPWRFQGRMLESSSASPATDLYDFGARSYDPSLGAFTSFDSVSGSAQNPLTLNRYLYANANPATLVDPDGHAAKCYGGDYCPLDVYSRNADAKDQWKIYQGLVKQHQDDMASGGHVVTTTATTPPRMVQEPCPAAGPDPSGQTRSCPAVYITEQQAKDEYGWGMSGLNPTAAGGANYASAALMCLMGGELDGVGCLPFVGMTVYTFANAGNNLLSGQLNPAEGWNGLDATTAGLGTAGMGLIDVGMSATLGLSFGIGVGSDLISQVAQDPGHLDLGHVVCSGLQSAWSASLAEQKAIGNNPKQAIIWDTINTIASTVQCKGT